MKENVLNHYQNRAFLSQAYIEQIICAFKKSYQVVSLPTFLAEEGWIYIADTTGNVLGYEKVGNPAYAIEAAYPVSENGGIMQENSRNGQIVVSLPVVEDVWFPSCIGVVLPPPVERRAIDSFLLAFAGVFRFMQERYIEGEIHLCIQKVNQNLHLDNVMQTIVQRVAHNLAFSDCVAVVFDEDQDSLLPRWSSSEAKLLNWHTEVLSNSQKVYETVVSRFSNKRTILRTGDVDVESVLGLRMLLHEVWLIAPFRHQEKVIGFLAVIRDRMHPFTDQEEKFVCRFTDGLSPTVHNSTLHMRAQRDEQKQAMLFEITKKFHSSINVDDVLQAVIENMRKLYPDMDVDLWMSHDSFSTALPVKQFSISIDGNSVSAQAFMEARTVMVRSEGARSLTLAAPLRGKQGVYGVLELYSCKPVSLSLREVEYISMLADTAGNAFENAQLYEQSRRLIKELLLIDEMTSQLNKNIKLNELLAFITRKLTESFRTEHCCIFSWSDEEDAFIMRASGQEDEEDYILPTIPSFGRLHELFVKKEPILLASGADKEIQIASFTYESLMAVPLLEKEEVKGAILLLDSTPNRYTFDDFKRLEMLSRHVKVAVTNASLHAEVERMVVTDNLTGLYNRKYLYDSIRQSQKRDICGSLILIDVDHFKNVNDTYGHQTGDEILIQVASELQASIRTSDIAARWGGEEMAVYLPKVQADIAHQVAERLRINIMNKTSPSVTISSGVSAWVKEENEETGDVQQLFQLADEALYKAKRTGRNQVCVAGLV
ncbi:diguanylate cyclase [Aneurinibacillus sp. BA2021]|nr:diguanylate cyclase [Aneurinibacillus sp. BA2021]